MGRELPSVGCELPNLGSELPSLGRELPSVGRELLSMGCKQPSANIEGCELPSPVQTSKGVSCPAQCKHRRV